LGRGLLGERRVGLFSAIAATADRINLVATTDERGAQRERFEHTAQSVELDMHVLNLGEDQWTHHGFLAYEGEAIAATYSSAEEAWITLTE
jgi:hypothetical protein